MATRAWQRFPCAVRGAATHSGVESYTDPGDEWLELWWSVDGRGGPAERETARSILAGYWLLVTIANPGAQQLYAKAGFRETGRYLYRQERPKRHLTGC